AGPATVLPSGQTKLADFDMVPVHFSGGQALGAGVGGVTQAQTPGELSNVAPTTQRAFCTHWQMPLQSVSPAFGSHESLGSSMQRPLPGQRIPARPPQRTAEVGGGLHWQVGHPDASSTL